jgi:uncharacterized protein (DUF1501 family)
MSSICTSASSGRRDFLKTTGLATLALSTADFALAQSAPAPAPGQAPAASGDTLVVVYLRGALDGLSAVVPYTDPNYYAQRPSLAIARPSAASAASIALDAQFSLHPALAPLKPMWDAGELAIAHAVGLVTPSRSHFDAQDFMERAWMEKLGLTTGWLNRYLSASASERDKTFRAVGLGRALPRALAGPAPTVGLSSIESFGISSSSTRGAALEATLLDTFAGSDMLGSTAQRAFAAVDELAAIPNRNYAVENGAVYPNSSFAYQLKDLSQLIKSNIGVEVATLDLGGWDTHNNQNNELPNLLDELAKSLAAFRTDLGARMQRVTVITMTEFGRRVAQNGSQGTDHGRGSCMFAMGAGVAGKQVYAEWPGLAANQLDSGDLRVSTDYRSVLAELLSKRYGRSDLSSIFPGYVHSKTPGLFLSRG